MGAQTRNLKCNSLKLTCQLQPRLLKIEYLNMWFQKISMTTPQKGSDFPRGRGGLICLIFQWEGGGGAPQGDISRGFS